ncbi:MAG: hypothetical protein JWP25_3572 [Bradyrhizobium sp.]|nr:hypothetical protein [Bradyrhizobium sp.]
MNDNVHPSLQPFLKPIPFEAIGKPGRRASELDRDNAAMALAGHVVALLKFGPTEGWQDELLKRANKVRISQGNGAVTFIAETAERIRAAAEPGFTKASFDEIEAELARQMAEPVFDGDFIGAPT